MNVHEAVNAAFSAVLPNTFRVELPPSPTWPSAVFDIDSVPEDAWCLNGGYDRHTVNLIILSPDADQIELFKPLFRIAAITVPGYMYEDDYGDADYEPDPNVYGYFMTFVVRTPRY